MTTTIIRLLLNALTIISDHKSPNVFRQPRIRAFQSHIMARRATVVSRIIILCYIVRHCRRTSCVRQVALDRWPPPKYDYVAARSRRRPTAFGAVAPLAKEAGRWLMTSGS